MGLLADCEPETWPVKAGQVPPISDLILVELERRLHTAWSGIVFSSLLPTRRTSKCKNLSSTRISICYLRWPKRGSAMPKKGPHMPGLPIAMTTPLRSASYKTIQSEMIVIGRHTRVQMHTDFEFMETREESASGRAASCYWRSKHRRVLPGVLQEVP
jgi:hypothetical protein